MVLSEGTGLLAQVDFLLRHNTDSILSMEFVTRYSPLDAPAAHLHINFRWESVQDEDHWLGQLVLLLGGVLATTLLLVWVRVGGDAHARTASTSFSSPLCPAAHPLATGTPTPALVSTTPAVPTFSVPPTAVTAHSVRASSSVENPSTGESLMMPSLPGSSSMRNRMLSSQGE
jgi:hypothetical protein